MRYFSPRQYSVSVIAATLVLLASPAQSLPARATIRTDVEKFRMALSVQGSLEHSPGRSLFPPHITKVNILSASLAENSIVVRLKGDDADSGGLDIGLVGAGNPFVVHVNRGHPFSPGTYEIVLKRTIVPADEYTSITATWNVAAPVSDTFDLHPHWDVGAKYRYSVYNTPLESNCDGHRVKGWTFNKACVFHAVQYKSEFLMQVLSTGTGLKGQQLLKSTQSLTSRCKAKQIPAGATKMNSLLEIPSVTGKCNKQLDASSVATYGGKKYADKVNLHFTCRAHVLLVNMETDANFETKINRDECPSCWEGFKDTKGHIDAYVTDQSCHLDDLGNFWTANLHGEGP